MTNLRQQDIQLKWIGAVCKSIIQSICIYRTPSPHQRPTALIILSRWDPTSLPVRNDQTCLWETENFHFPVVCQSISL